MARKMIAQMASSVLVIMAGFFVTTMCGWALHRPEAPKELYK